MLCSGPLGGSWQEEIEMPAAGWGLDIWIELWQTGNGGDRISAGVRRCASGVEREKRTTDQYNILPRSEKVQMHRYPVGGGGGRDPRPVGRSDPIETRTRICVSVSG